MIKLYNSLSQTIEEFEPFHPPKVGMYTCGPTVYDFAHIGNFRTYTTADLLVRVLQYNNYDVTYIMNLTDVGHLTGDNLGNADTGEDRMEKAAKREGKTAWDIAAFYTKAFLADYKKLNLTEPKLFAKATEHIKDQIDLIKHLEEKGFTYKISDGIYFNTFKFPDYGKLSNLDKIKEGVRVEINPEKKNPRDFALWKFSPKGKQRQMEWNSPWGKGFPGWHIECSAMSMKYLGLSFDIHVGGVDLRSTHHPNEIAQSEAATGKQFVKYWVHSAFMLIDGQRMSKSLQNNYTVSDIEQHGFDPLALRYFYLQTHYRQEMNFTFQALESAQTALKNLRDTVREWDLATAKQGPPSRIDAAYEQEFIQAINQDLNMSKAVAIMWDLVKSKKVTSSQKAATLLEMNKVFGLGLEKYIGKKLVIPAEVFKMVEDREYMRKQKRFTIADQIRHKINKMGFDIEDKKGEKPKIRKIE